MKTYQDTVGWMFQQLPMYQRIGKQAFKKDLTNTLKLATYLNNPEKRFRSIHVAGTNGKGSVSHMLASVFQAAGYKTGLYTSPHLKDFRERIRINGKMIAEEGVIAFIDKNQDFLEENKLSFFEMTVGMAFDYFANEKVDIAIIETGMGGRLDSTNIIKPELSVITNIGFDHTAFLGNDLPSIAAEKAGIIKPNTPVVIGQKNRETSPVFIASAKEYNADIHFAEKFEHQQYQTDLKGEYQKINIQTVYASLKVLEQIGWELTEKSISKGLKTVKATTGLRGRWDILKGKPKVICDTAHNKEGLKFVMKQLSAEQFESLHIVLGVVNDKDLNSILPLFPKDATYYFAKPDVPRGLEAKSLQREAMKFDLSGNVYTSVEAAYQTALNISEDEDLIFIGGSNFTVAEVI